MTNLMHNSFLLHVYFDFNPLHVSNTFELIIRRVRIVLIQRLVYITLYEWPSGMHTGWALTQGDIYQTLIRDGHSHRVIYTRRS
jgi:hypothetical protein